MAKTSMTKEDFKKWADAVVVTGSWIEDEMNSIPEEVAKFDPEAAKLALNLVKAQRDLVNHFKDRLEPKPQG